MGSRRYGTMSACRRTPPLPRDGCCAPATVIGLLFLLLVVLALLAIPFLKAPGHAEGAKADLEAARTSLSAGDVDAAEASVQSARRHADQVQGAMQGIGGDIWSLVPVVGGPVSDVRHLGNALDHLTTAAELAVDAWPAVNGEQATLFDDRSVDVPTLEEAGRGGRRGERRTSTPPRLELGEVDDSGVGVGTRLAEARDEATEVVAPLAATARRAKPARRRAARPLRRRRRAHVPPGPAQPERAALLRRRAAHPRRR